MRSFLGFIIKYPMASVIVLVITVFAGIYSARHMPVDLFPGIDVPVVNIISHYPGAASADMELLVSRPVEDEMRSIAGVKRVVSTSLQGVSLVSVEFNSGTGIREARQVAQARLARLRSVLPAAVTPSIESIGTTLQEVSGYVIYGAGDPVTLRNIVKTDLAGGLRGVEGVSSIEVLGGDRRAYYVTLRPEALRRLHISIPEVVTLLKKQNISAVAGFLSQSGREYLIRGDARLKNMEDIRTILLKKGDGGKTVLLGDVAKVSEGRRPRHYVVRGDGLPAVALIVRKQPGASTLRIVSAVESAMGELKDLLPPGSTIKKYYDQSEIISESRHEIIQNLVIGAVLAVAVLYFFLASLPATLIVAGTIPLTLLATVALMRVLGLTFNIITMTALTLAIGMIVDDAIVVAENIFRHAKTIKDPARASITGAAEIAAPDASGTFTTVAAFLPLVMVTGLAAIFLRPFAITIGSALLVSLILSLTLVPLLFGHIKGASIQRNGFMGERFLGLLERCLQRILSFSFRHRKLVIILCLMTLGLSGLTLLLGRASLLPPIDEGAILIEYIMPPGTSLIESNRIGEALDRMAMADPDVSTVYRRTGSPEVGYQVEGVNRGELFIKLRPRSRRSRSVAEITASIKRSFSTMNGMVFLYHQPTQEKIDESFSGLPALFGVTIYGTDMEKLTGLAGEVEGILTKDPAISNVINNTKVRQKEVTVRLDRGALAKYGVEPAEVLTTLQATRLGVEATRIIRQKGDVAVMVRLGGGEAQSPEDIRLLPIGGKSALPLERVAHITVRPSPASITRINGRREITLIAELEGNFSTVIKRLQRRFDEVQLPAGYSIEFAGQYRVLMKTALEMAFTLMAAMVLIYLIMVMQFHALMQPLVILLTIPLSFIGALIALFLTGQGVDVSVAMGAVTLAGIAVNNAIVLMDCSNRERSSGKGTFEALSSAVSVRLRPILLTTFTTIAALLPAAIGTTTGSRIFQPFAITVIGGLLSSVAATLIIVPTLASFLPSPKKKPCP